MVDDLVIDYEYILFCYNALRSGKRFNVDLERLNESKKLISMKDKNSLDEDDRLAVYRLSFIDGCLR